MTAGEHGGRDSGYDDQTFPSGYPADGGRGGSPWDPVPSAWDSASPRAAWDPAPPRATWDPEPPHAAWDPASARATWDPDQPTTTFPGLADPGYPPRSPERPGDHGPGPAPDPDGRYPQRPSRKRRGLPLWQELPLLLVIAFCLAVLIRTFLLQAFYIPSGSMEDTLTAGDRVLVNKVVYQFREPARGEVVVFRGTAAWAPQPTGDDDVGVFAKVGRALGDLVGISRPGEKDYIKRVIGLPGDTVSCCDVDGRVFVNGQPLDEDYVVRDSPLEDGSPDVQDCRGRRFDEVVVQPGQMFVMGDHRQVSKDSRCQGQVPIENVIGRAFVIVWPSDRWGGLSAPDTFASVPEPAVVEGLGPAQVDLPPGAVGRPDPGPLVLLPVPWALAARSRFIQSQPRRRLSR